MCYGCENVSETNFSGKSITPNVTVIQKDFKVKYKVKYHAKRSLKIKRTVNCNNWVAVFQHPPQLFGCFFRVNPHSWLFEHAQFMTLQQHIDLLLCFDDMKNVVIIRTRVLVAPHEWKLSFPIDSAPHHDLHANCSSAIKILHQTVVKETQQDRKTKGIRFVPYFSRENDIK